MRAIVHYRGVTVSFLILKQLGLVQSEKCLLLLFASLDVDLIGLVYGLIGVNLEFSLSFFGLCLFLLSFLGVPDHTSRGEEGIDST